MYTIVDLCLLCLENDNKLKSILSEDSDGVRIEEKLRFFLLEFVNIEPVTSTYLCFHCLEKLNHVYNFKQLCLQNIDKLNTYIHTLKNTDISCTNLQVTLIDMKHLKGKLVKCENESNGELIKTENFNLDSNDCTEYVLQDEFRQEEDDETVLTNENIVVKTEREDNLDNDDNNNAQKGNATKEEGPIIVHDELKYVNIDDIIEIKEPEEMCEHIDITIYKKLKDEIQTETTNNAEYLSTSDTHPRNIEEMANESYKCYVCDEAFCTKSKLKTHIVTHSGVQHNHKSTLIAHKPKQTDKIQYKCDLCGKTFHRLDWFTRHKLSRICQNPYECETCGKGFNRALKLKVHRFIHTGEKPYKCDVCDKAFNTSSILSTHKLVHTGLKRYKCDECDKTFALNSNLKVHKRLHTPGETYKCNICGKGLASTRTLALHTQKCLCRKASRDKCNLCGKIFNCLGLLTRHKRLRICQKPHECDFCGKGFHRKIALKLHRLIHTGDKPYKCDICDKAFNAPSNLNRHKLDHSGLKPHKCDACDKVFTRNDSLTRHLARGACENPAFKKRAIYI